MRLAKENILLQIETVIIRQREAKRGSSKTEAQDKAINLLRVRYVNSFHFSMTFQCYVALVHLRGHLALSICFSADLQKAVDSENYALAAALRDEIAKLEVQQNCSAPAM